jgi:hypothetical protein
MQVSKSIGIVLAGKEAGLVDATYTHGCGSCPGVDRSASRLSMSSIYTFEKSCLEGKTFTI